MALMLSL